MQITVNSIHFHSTLYTCTAIDKQYLTKTLLILLKVLLLTFPCFQNHTSIPPSNNKPYKVKNNNFSLLLGHMCPISDPNLLSYLYYFFFFFFFFFFTSIGSISYHVTFHSDILFINFIIMLQLSCVLTCSHLDRTSNTSRVHHYM